MRITDEKATEGQTRDCSDNSGILLQSSVSSSIVLKLDSSSPPGTAKNCKQFFDCVNCSRVFDAHSDRLLADSSTKTCSLYSDSPVCADTNGQLNCLIGSMNCSIAFDARTYVETSEQVSTDSDKTIHAGRSNNFVRVDTDHVNTVVNCSLRDTESESIRSSNASVLARTRGGNRSDRQTFESTMQSANLIDAEKVDTDIHLHTDTDPNDGGSDDTLVLAKTRERSFACDVCDRKFTKSYNLKNHLRVHTGERPFTCSVCDKRFINGSNLKTHLRVHSGERPYRCSVCNKTFSESTHLKTHMRTHTHERPFGCEVCGKSFAQSQQLKTHAQIHSAERNFCCEVCSRTFARPENLKRHLRVHSLDPNVRADGRRFRCDVCSADFVRPEHLRRHMRTVHVGDQPFRCYVCNKRFTQSHHLQVHLRIHAVTRE